MNTNRDVRLYTLDVLPEKREEVRKFAEFNVLPENKYYYYHHFKDNCSTRIRDIIDLATDGQFKTALGEAPGRFTLRQHVRRHTWFAPFGDWILNFLMGQDIDTPITIWEEMFLPSEVGRQIANFRYTAADGLERKLVSDVQTVYKATGRPVVLLAPRRQWPRELAFSLALSALLGLFYGIRTKNRKMGRVLVGIYHSIAGFAFGIAALVLYFMTFFTDHDYTYHNANILFATPLLIVAIPLGVRYALGRDEGRRFGPAPLLRILWLLVALGIFVSMLIKFLPWFYQQNLVDQMLMLPLALTFTLDPEGLSVFIRRGHGKTR